MSYWRRSPCSQSGEVQEAVVHRDDEVGDQSGHGERPALLLDAVDGDHAVGAVGAVVAVEVPHRARQRGADEALVGVGIVQPAHLERHEAGVAELERLLEPALAEVPEVQPAAVAPGGDVIEIETGLIGRGLAELRRGQHVLARLVPEVVVEPRARPAVLPATLELERPRVQHGKAARAVAVGVAEHADDDVLAGHAVDGVRTRQAGRADELVGARSPSRSAGAADRRRHRRRGSATSGSRARSDANDRAHGRRSCNGSSRSDAAHRRRSASASRARSGRPRHRPPRGSPAAPRRCPRAGTRHTGTPPAARFMRLGGRGVERLRLVLTVLHGSSFQVDPRLASGSSAGGFA